MTNFSVFLEYEAVIFAREFRIAEKRLEASGMHYTHFRMTAFQVSHVPSASLLASS